MVRFPPGFTTLLRKSSRWGASAEDKNSSGKERMLSTYPRKSDKRLPAEIFQIASRFALAMHSSYEPVSRSETSEAAYLFTYLKAV